MTRANDLTPLLKRLQLWPMAATLPERIALARREQLDYDSFLEIILSYEVNRRAHRRIAMRLRVATGPIYWDRTPTAVFPCPSPLVPTKRPHCFGGFGLRAKRPTISGFLHRCS